MVKSTQIKLRRLNLSIDVGRVTLRQSAPEICMQTVKGLAKIFLYHQVQWSLLMLSVRPE